MKLNEAIEKLVSEQGVSVVASHQFVNILDDMGAFRSEPPATKKITKELLAGGLTEILQTPKKSFDEARQNEEEKCVARYIATSGYQDELVRYIAMHLMYGVGLQDSAPLMKPLRPEVGSKHHSSIAADSYAALSEHQRKYQASLSELLTIGSDRFGHEYGYYTAEANTTLYILSEKIKLLARETDREDIDSWLEQERARILAKHRPSERQMRMALKETAQSLEADLKTFMKKSVVTTDDEFGLKSASFNAGADDEFRKLEQKIITVGKRMGEDRTSYIERTKRKFLEAHSSPESARKGALDTLRQKYLARLKELDSSTRGKAIDTDDAELADIRRKLINLGALMNLDDLDKWCTTQNSKFIYDRTLRRAKHRKRKIVASTVGGLLLLMGGCGTVVYTSSADSRSAFERTMSAADAAVQKGELAKALSLYIKAGNDYDATYATTTYKNKAHEKAVAVSDRLTDETELQVSAQLEAGDPLEAKMLLTALPAEITLSPQKQENFKTLTDRVETALANRVEVVTDELLDDIYANGGKLSSSGRTKLEKYLKAVPDNYWLNFINEKTK